jgi:tetratricopeptide (TPR) repeat protein
MGRRAAVARGDYPVVEASAKTDLVIMGQLRTRGSVYGTVTTSAGVFDTSFFDLSEVAVQTLPRAYYDLGLSAFHNGRYSEALRWAQRSIENGAFYYSKDEWTALRLLNLRECHLLAYKACMALGTLDRAALHYRQYLTLWKVTDTRNFRELQSQLVCIRMSAMRGRSDYLAKQHVNNLMQILNALAAAGNAAAASNARQNGNYRTAAAHQAAITANIAAIAMIEAYKQKLKLEFSIDMTVLMAEAERSGEQFQTAPSAEDIRRAKQASDLYRCIRLADTVNPANKVDISGIAKDLETMAPATLMTRNPDGSYTLSSKAAAFIQSAAKLDKVPLSISAQTLKEDDALDRLVTPELCRMAGITVSTSEMALLNKLCGDNAEKRLDPNTEEGRQAIVAFNKLVKKAGEFEKWNKKS